MFYTYIIQCFKDQTLGVQFNTDYVVPYIMFIYVSLEFCAVQLQMWFE